MKAIFAVDPRGGIGYKNSLPWSRLDGDLARFKQLTTGEAVLMGRHTWESLPTKPLPNRKNIVISSSELDLPEDVIQINDIRFVDSVDNIWCIGGAKLIESVWGILNEVHLTRARQEYTCDIFVDLVYLEKNFTKTQSVPFRDNDYEIWIRQ